MSNPAGKEKLIEIATCKSPHGIKGEFSIYLYNSTDSSLEYIHELMLFPFDNKSSLDQKGQSFRVERVRLGVKNILKLTEISTRNAAEEIIPFRIFIKRSDLKEVENDEVYLNDLIGHNVFDDSGNELGVVDSFYDNGVQDVMVVKGAKNIDVLMIDQFIVKIDSEKKEIIIKTMEVI